MGVMQDERQGEAGFSLIEIVIALGLFSLISLAGVVLVSSILGVRERTEGRLEELGQLQRGLMVMGADFQQAKAGSIRLDATGASLARIADGGTLAVRYAVQEGQVLRTLSINGAPGPQQPLLDQIAALRWRVLLSSGGWIDVWPRPGDPLNEDAERVQPIALAVELDLAETRAGVSGTVRRVVELAEAP